jgi:hypothetical protein
MALTLGGALVSVIPDASAEAPRRLHVRVLPAEGLDEAPRRALEQAIAGGARAVIGAEVVTADAGADAEAEAEAEQALERSDRALEGARERLRNLDLDGALDLLDWAADEYVRHLPELMIRDGNGHRLVETFTLAATVHYLGGDEGSATTALRRALVLEPTLEYDPTRFPPQLQRLVLDERLLFDELGTGSLSIRADGVPAKVRVLVNGVERGVAPLVVDDLPAGPNLVHLRAAGAEPQVLTGVLDGPGVVPVRATLVAAAPGDLLLAAAGDVGRRRASARLGEAAEALGVDALLVVAPAVSGEVIDLSAWVYDLREGRLAGRARVELTAGETADAGALGRAAVTSAGWVAGVALVEAASRPPIWEHRYFWPAVGAAAGVVLVSAVWVAATDGISTKQKVGLFPVIEF